MGEQSQSTKSNRIVEPTLQKSSGVSKNGVKDFEFCKVCNRNHDQGQRHKYFPNHKKSLSTFLSRFQSKISDILFFLKNPNTLRPEHASRNRFWCVFCDTEIDEIGSSLACSHAINHLASDEHLKNLKHFLWKNGGEMNRLDALRISDADLAKWEKKCRALKGESISREGCIEPVIGPSYDIQNQLNCGNIDSFENNYFQCVNSCNQNGVLPLQYYTHEYQVSHSGHFDVGSVYRVSHNVTSYSGANEGNLKDLAVDRMYHSLLHDSEKHQTGVYLKDRGVCGNGRMLCSESSSLGQNLSQVSSVLPKTQDGNVHSGAPPPWFEATERNQLDSQLVFRSHGSTSNKSRKTKLNPKRVGAAWAEKRKIELEMEKRGEIVRNEFDCNWLPNFGRVWQSGSRKESRKEFEKEKHKLPKVENQSVVQIEPYVSKRMRRDLEGGDATAQVMNLIGDRES